MPCVSNTKIYNDSIETDTATPLNQLEKRESSQPPTIENFEQTQDDAKIGEWIPMTIRE